MTQLQDLYTLHNFIDTFALGHYARVMDGMDLKTNRQVAFKVMRPEHIARGEEPKWEYRAFHNEANLLIRLADDPHIIRLYDCGYISSNADAPHDGEIESFGLDVEAFTAATIRFSARGWRPYLALESLPRSQNLFYSMRPDRANLRFRLPTEEGITLALQFGQTLRTAHNRGIIFLDHKLEHVYWDGETLRIIDWNSSRLLPEDQRDNSSYFRTDIHNLSVGILYSVFTGLSPHKAALRPQPGSQSEVETRYQDVTSLDFGVEPSLSVSIQQALQQGASQELENIDEFLLVWNRIAAQHGWSATGNYTSPANREARDQMRDGLWRLRKGEEYIREARDLFRDAAVVDGVDEEVVGELRRLIKAVNETLNNRAIP